MNELTNIQKWRLILGSDSEETLGQPETELRGMDQALEQLYDKPASQGGLGKSAPNVTRWLRDIREYFPSTVVKVMQEDALKKYRLTSMLTEPEMLETVVPDVHLVAHLLELGGVIPARTKETARVVVRKVVDELMQKLSGPMHQAVSGSLNRAARNRRPKHNEIDWNETIRRNLKHYQPDYQTVIPEVRIGYGRKQRALKDIILCIDQSGSMGTSVVYSGIFGAVLATIPAVETRMVVFDTAVVDLTDDLHDPVDLLFGVQLGGGTDIHKALSYCRQIITRPLDTTLILISDLCEGGPVKEMRATMKNLVDSGVQIISLLALNDEGAPWYDHQNAGFLAALDVPVFACTPDLFPDMMAAALSKQDIQQWAGNQDLKLGGV